MQATQINDSELAILRRVLQPEKPTLTADAAQSLLALDFDDTDKARMHELSVKAQEGSLTQREQVELNNFERVGHFIGLIWSKARRSLKAHNRTNGSHRSR